jgi:hypothetical protein
MVIEIHKPELESLIRERMESGGFQDVEDVLMHAMHALKSSPTREHPIATPRKPKKSFGQFLLESPLRNSGLKLERQKDFPRPIDL